jgi:hypothetical protein
MTESAFILSDIERACGVTLEDVRAFALTSTITDGMAVIDQHATPAQAGATARYLLGAPVDFSHLAMGAYPVYRVAGAR